MASSAIRFRGLKGFQAAMSDMAKMVVMQGEIKKATKKNGVLVKKAMREKIASGSVGPRNKGLTIRIKGADTPLMDTGLLSRSVVNRVVSWRRVVVGIPRNKRRFKQAQILTNGAMIPVSDAMRNMFKLLFLVSHDKIPSSTLRGRAAMLWEAFPGPWFPLGFGKSVIRIPPRPFVDDTLKDRSVKQAIKNNYTLAVSRGFKKITAKAKRGK